MTSGVYNPPCGGSAGFVFGVGALIRVLPVNESIGPVVNGVALSIQFSSEGGTGPYTYAVVAGSMPDGLTLDADGTLHGTPTVSDDFTFTVEAVDTHGVVGTHEISMTVQDATDLVPALAASALPPGTNGLAYSHDMAGSGGTEPYAFAVTDGDLPDGLSLSAGGAITGTCSSAGNFVFTVSVTDDNGRVGSGEVTLRVNDPVNQAPVVVSTTLPSGINGSAYSYLLNTSGGTGPYAYALAGGSDPLPDGLTLDADGTLHGTPTVTDTFVFTVEVTDDNGLVGSQAITMTVEDAPVDITLASSDLKVASQNAVYSAHIVASGGASPYAYAITDGALPVGLDINASTGEVSGTPTDDNDPGYYAFTVTATDANSETGSQAFVLALRSVYGISVLPALPVVSYEADHTYPVDGDSVGPAGMRLAAMVVTGHNEQMVDTNLILTLKLQSKDGAGSWTTRGTQTLDVATYADEIITFFNAVAHDEWRFRIEKVSGTDGQVVLGVEAVFVDALA